MTFKTLVLVLAVSTVGLTAAGWTNDASAAIYRGTFDPSDFNRAWQGTHRFDVSDGCLGGNASFTGWVAAVSGTACEASLIGGSLTLEALDGTGNPQNPRVLDTLNFGQDPDVFGVYFAGGQLVGVDTGEIGGFLFPSGEDFGFNLGAQGGFFLRWESGQAPGAQDFGSSVYLTVLECSGTVDIVCLRSEVTPGLRAVATFERVPEPATLTLVLAAVLAGAGVTRWRRGGAGH